MPQDLRWCQVLGETGPKALRLIPAPGAPQMAMPREEWLTLRAGQDFIFLFSLLSVTGCLQMVCFLRGTCGIKEGQSGSTHIPCWCSGTPGEGSSVSIL